MNVGSTASANSAAQEALETAAETKAEASKGDRQAILKLAREAAAKGASPEQPTATQSSAKQGFEALA